MLLAESETLASRFPELRDLISQIDAKLIEIDELAILRIDAWATNLARPRAIVGRIFDEYVKEGVLTSQVWRQCDCGNLRSPQATVFGCSACGRELSEMSEQDLVGYMLGHSAASAIRQIQSLRAKLSRARRLRILFVSSNPADEIHLRTDREFRELRDAVGDEADVFERFGTRFDELQGLLLRHDPEVVHLSVHGIKDDGILFESTGGLADLIANEQVLSVLEQFRDKLLLVVLSSCHSVHLGNALTDFVPAVIAMKHAIGDRAAVRFSGTFYLALVRGKSLQNAFEQGIAAMKATGVGDEDIPRLLVRRGVDPRVVLLNPR